MTSTTNLLAQTDTTYNLLWKIEKEGIPNSGYLFGTMHVHDDRAFGFADSVMLALDECEVFALEVHPDTMVKASFELMMESDSTNYFEESLSEEEYIRFLEEFSKENGIDFEELDNKHPINVDMYSNEYQGNQDRTTFVDMHLYGVARSLGKEIIGLEPIENQFNALFDMTMHKARFGMYRDTFFQRLIMEELIESYDEGNLEQLEKIIGQGFPMSPLMIKRNEDMVNTIVSTINDQSIFAAVGAAHLIGDESVISMLEEKGFSLSRVSSTFTGIADQYEIDPSYVHWEMHVDINGGFQINYPQGFTVMDQKIPFESEFGKDSIEVKIRLYTDLTNMKNYLITYNDFPLGYYLESSEVMYEGLEEEIVANGTTILSHEDIVHRNRKGRLYNCLLPGGYHAIMHVFFRGNRVYRFLVQNLRTEVKEFDESELIGTLKFLPYAECELKLATKQGIELPYFDKYSMVVDSVVYDELYLNEGFDWYINDPCTGNTYSISMYDLKDLFWVSDLDSFYIEYADNHKTWNDTIVSAQFIFKDGIKGYETIVTNEAGETFNRHKYWFVDNKAVTYSVYSDSIGLYCDNAKAFFNTPLLGEDAKQEALIEDKTSRILSGLYDADTTISKRALGALSYSTVDSTHTGTLEQLFIDHYTKDTLHRVQSKSILNILYETPSYDARKLSLQIAKNHNALDELRSCAITKLYELGDTTEALQILFERMPASMNYWCNVLRPFYDSNELVYEHADALAANLDKSEHRLDIINLFISMADEGKPEYIQKIDQHYDVIVSHYDSETDTMDYQTQHYMNVYMRFFSSCKSKRNQHHIDGIDTTGFPVYMIQNWAIARLSNNLSVEQSIIDSLVSSDYEQYELQKKLHQIDMKEALPDSLRSETSIYLGKLKQFMYENEYYVTNPEYLGEYMDDENTYVAYKLIEKYEDEEYCYLGLVNKTKRSGQYVYNDVKSYIHYTEECNWEEWEQLAKEKSADFRAYAY